jgi:D-alanine-D-alanine ligase
MKKNGPDMNNRFKNVAVLMGGFSSEREVSLRSGAAVAQGLRDGGYTVTEIDVRSRSLSIPHGVEAVFIALHGEFGEDGDIQLLLAEMNLPFTGSGPESSRVSFDKVLTRERLDVAEIPVPQGEVLSNPDDRSISFPLVIKPPREGSSVGCHIVRSESDWETAYSDAVRFSGDALVEAYIPGRELTVGIVEWGDAEGSAGDAQVLPVVEIKTAGGWYDYEAKYVTGETSYSVPAELEPAITEELQAIALKTFNCLGARGFGRIDFRLTREGIPYVLELNAIPGFTVSSLLPKAAEAAGIGFSELCCRIMELASTNT